MPLEQQEQIEDQSDTADTLHETIIDGWRLLREISSTPRVRDRYLAVAVNGDQQAVVTLYHHGAEPDPTVYEVVKRLPREYVPEIYSTGRFNGRAYEVAEHIVGGTLSDLGIVASDLQSVRQVVHELGKALNAFSEVGLRHRDLRPGTLLARSRDPLDLVIGSFGSARLSEFDLDIVSPLEVTPFMAPEAIAGGVAAASDWWSLGMVLLEQVTRGACFAGINHHAFLIHVLAHGVDLPNDLDPSIDLLLRGLLAKDRHQRWQWPQVAAWLAGEQVTAPPRVDQPGENASSAFIQLGERRFRRPALYALSAAEKEHWNEALDHLSRGVLLTWAQELKLEPKLLSGLRQIAQHEAIDEHFRLMLALKLFNPEMPLIHQGDIVTPRWLLEHPIEGYELVTGAVPDLLEQLETETWLSRLKSRCDAVRARARNLGAAVDEDALRINLLSTSRARLAAVWEERREIFPDTSHHGLLSILERKIIAEEDLIVLLSAELSQFRSRDAILQEAAERANSYAIAEFDAKTAQQQLSLSRLELIQAVNDRTSGFARCAHETINRRVDQFRLEKRVGLVDALVILAVPEDQWETPPQQQYVSQILDFYAKRISAAVMRGPLVRMTIGKSTPRVDLHELNTDRIAAGAVLDHVLQRNQHPIAIDPAAFRSSDSAESRLHSLARHSVLYKRDTGIDGLYLGFPFLITRDARASVKTRIAPLLLWPIQILLNLGNRGIASLAFDNDREEVRINPALELLIGTDATKRWRKTAEELLARSTLKASVVMDGFGTLASSRARTLRRLPGPNTEVPAQTEELECAAVLFHVTFIGQAIGEDLRQLKSQLLSNTGLESALRLDRGVATADGIQEPLSGVSRELDRFFTVASDPSQEAAVLQARSAPGVLVEGPPGTGKSQTIVNMVGDAIGRKRSLLIICQKHAALAVVHKRLVAEGLGDRVVMLNDINKDRTQIIKSIREQLESLHRRTSDPTVALRRQRESVASRIVALESAIDRQHSALHKVNPRIGVSYRTLLGELMALEAPRSPLDVPALRPILQRLDIGALASLEEECAPLAIYWLPARYEDSPLAQLLSFAPDRASLADFLKAFDDFIDAERLRTEVLLTRPSPFEINDPAPHKAWLEAYGRTFLALQDSRRLLLARWLPLFRPAPALAPTGPQLIAQLETLSGELNALQLNHYDKLLSPSLSELQKPDLDTLRVATEYAASRSSWFGNLNPLRILRRRRVRAFLRQQNDEPSDARMDVLLAACRLERTLGPLREALSKIHKDLKLPDISPDAALTLKREGRGTLASLKDIGDLASQLAQAPWANTFDRAAALGSREAMLKLFASFDAAFARYEARQASLRSLASFANWIKDDWTQQCGAAISSNHHNQTRIQPIHEALPTLPAYQKFRDRAQRLTAGARTIFACLRGKQAQLDKVPPTDLENEVRKLLNREARLGWKRTIEQEEPDLQLEDAEIQSKISSLASLDGEFRNLNRRLLSDEFDLPLINGLSKWEDITRLTGVRARRLREFIELGTPLGLLKLRPVWLMNPDVASRVLPLKPGLFDTVIYDEASQMPVEHALPSLFRGRISVVCGDEWQMPPTAFFASKVEDDEAELFTGEVPDEDATEEEREVFEETWNRREIKDCPDLLQLARSNLPNATLQIHYRSAYRELIAFSNACFYGNHLSVPVRHPGSTIRSIRPVELVRSDSLYQDQTNHGEATRVVEILADMWHSSYARRLSVGVVTFNRKQADLIEELLDERAESDALFREAFRQEQERHENGEDMGVFVKNVENVQGDERDVIVFSSTFGRNSQGTFRRAFGVLGQKGGERRLNVAVTRARQKIIMVTSMPISDISDLLNAHRQPATARDFLQAYMEYARTVSNGEFDTARALLRRITVTREGPISTGRVRADDGFTESVAGFVRALGCNASASPEDDAFGLDFVIEHPTTGLFAIGIECDAPRHELLAHGRAREVWRPKVLRHAIPLIHRVSSRGWYHSPQLERERLQASIQAALQ